MFSQEGASSTKRTFDLCSLIYLSYIKNDMRKDNKIYDPELAIPFLKRRVPLVIRISKVAKIPLLPP